MQSVAGRTPKGPQSDARARRALSTSEQPLARWARRPSFHHLDLHAESPSLDQHLIAREAGPQPDGKRQAYLLANAVHAAACRRRPGFQHAEARITAGSSLAVEGAPAIWVVPGWRAVTGISGLRVGRAGCGLVLRVGCGPVGLRCELTRRR